MDLENNIRKSRIKVRLARLGITAAELAAIIGITPGHLSKIVTGKHTPGDELAKAIATHLKTTRKHINL